MALKGTVTVIVGVSTIVPWSTLAGSIPVLHTLAAVAPSVVIGIGAPLVIVQVETPASPVSEQTVGVVAQSVIVSPVSEAVPVLDSVAVVLAPVNVDKVRETLQPTGAPPLLSTAVIGNVVLPVPGSVILIEGGGVVVTVNPPAVTMAETVSHAVNALAVGLQSAAKARPAPLNAKRAISNRPMDSPTMDLVSFVLLMEIVFLLTSLASAGSFAFKGMRQDSISQHLLHIHTQSKRPEFLFYFIQALQIQVSEFLYIIRDLTTRFCSTSPPTT